MRILIPFSYYHPEQCAGLFVIDDMTAEAARQGISSLITVPTPTRNVEPGASFPYVRGRKESGATGLALSFLRDSPIALYAMGEIRCGFH